MSLADTSALPVYLLTGFLGSGKTTLLSRLVRSAAFQDTAVVINEFGEVGLDHLLVGQANDSDIVLLDSGCLCCAGSGSLAETLESLYYRRKRGELPAFARVVVETSGLADPGPVINTLASDTLIARHYRFGGAVATLDAVHGVESVQAYREAATQIAIADRIALTKTDIAGPAAIDTARQLLASRNPTARVLETTPTALDHQAHDLFDGLTAGHLEAVPAQAAGLSTPIAHVLRYGIASYLWRQQGPLGWDRYAAWVRAMQRDFGDRLLRAKGLLRWTDGTIRAVHGVHHLFNAPEPLRVDEGARQVGAMVIIARDVAADDLAEVMRLLD